MNQFRYAAFASVGRRAVDFDCGAIVRGESGSEEMGERILDLVVETASGRFITAAERLGQWDFIPWKRGVSL